MGEPTGLRSTLDNLRELNFDEIPSAKPPSGARARPAATGDSLLTSLLNETSEEANRELKELQDKLRERRHAEEEAKRKDDDTRRRHLDTLREQERGRREDRLRDVEGGPPVSKAQPVQTFVAPPIAPAKRSIGSWLVAGVALVAAGAAGTGWYLTQKNAAEQAKQREAEARAVPPANQKPVELTAPAAVAAAPAPVIIVKRPPVEARALESEQGESMRRDYEFNHTLAEVDPKAPAKVKTGRTGGKPAEPTTNSSGGPKIKIKALNLGGDK